MMPPPAELPPVFGRPTRAEIDPVAFRRNLALAAKHAGSDRQVMAVVKADAYGHGAPLLATAAREEGAAMLGVATVAEARDIAAAASGSPVVILSEVLPEAAAEVVRLGCRQVLYTRSLADALETAGRSLGRTVPVHLKVDTGMGRVGIAPAEVLPFLEYLATLPHIELEGFMTHLPEADSLTSERTHLQVAEFLRLADQVRAKAPEIRYVHVANSALIMRGESVGNLVRPGIMLYGSPPAPELPGGGELSPVMRFVTAVTFLKVLPPGSPVSYGGAFVTTRESLIATLPAGYADGYGRRLSNRTDVLIRGRRAPQVGTICMDMCLVDVTDVPGATVGDEVVVMGRQGRECISADELALKLETIPYEVYCQVGARVPRVPAPGAGGGGES